MTDRFQLAAPYQPAGDQPQAIQRLSEGFEAGLAAQTLLGVTGSGKTYTIANVIERIQRPTIVMAPNKTLAAQLYGEFKEFFPHNAVEYFVSYYDYYQPEAYVVASDTFIEKDASINEHIEQMRLSATKALLSRRDSIIVATVSAIYGLGNPEDYLSLRLILAKGERIDQRKLIHQLTELQYTRNEMELRRGTYRVRGEIIDVFPAESETEALRIELFDGEVENMALFDPLTGETIRKVQRYTVYPRTHYASTRESVLNAVETIKVELKERLELLYRENKLVEAQRLDQRTRFDLEMMAEVGYCQGIENYSRHLTRRAPGEPPPTLFDYLPADGLLVVDESHVTVPQLGAMYKGDRSRKETLVEFGFRLPSAMDNRPLRFEEWEERVPRAIYVSATPRDYELHKSGDAVTELVVRPTGLVDPEVEVRPVRTQVDDLLSEVHKRVAIGDRVLVTTLTKRMAENLTEYLSEHDVKVRYLHSDIETVERSEIIRDLRLRVRRAGRHQPAARRPGHARGVAGGDPRRRQGRLPAVHRLADPDHRPRRPQRARQGDPVRRQRHPLDAGGDGRDCPPPRKAGGVESAAGHHPDHHRAAHRRHHGGRAQRGGQPPRQQVVLARPCCRGRAGRRLCRAQRASGGRHAEEAGSPDVQARTEPGIRGRRPAARPDPPTARAGPALSRQPDPRRDIVERRKLPYTARLA